MGLIKAVRNNIPNTITCMNLLAGAIACIYALDSNTVHGSLTGYQWAFIFIAMAAVFDFCDGLTARMLHSVSPIGKELDSLSDCVSFGLAPAMLVYAALENIQPGCIVNYSAFLIAIFGALRLAKFNVDTTQTTTFKGLPIPANAIFWIGLVNMCYQGNGINVYIIYAGILFLSYMMVCDLPMFSFKMKHFNVKDNIYRYTLIVIVIASLATFGVSGLCYDIIAYMLLSLINKYSTKT